MIRIGFILLLTLLAGGCDSRYFGLSQAEWQQLSDADRARIIETYYAREESWEPAPTAVLTGTLRDASPGNGAEPEAAARIEQIYRGEGLPGQLIRVSLSGGTLIIDGQPRPYQAVRELLAEGESRLLVILEDDASRPRTSRLQLSYQQGTLYLDGMESQGGLGYPYRPDWEQGRLYERVDSNGPARLRNATLRVEAIPVSPSRWPSVPDTWR